uniref:Bifunctional inhibitor/plant lipid transfer protein/seed storage helical domain-containing protein n=1 Tax=Kalanchoe fedtschenkoi TaxID=63787 RepID=A0A7N0T3H1_KALFE
MSELHQWKFISSTSPSSSRCSRLASTVQSQPRCLCTALSGGAGIILRGYISINQTRALELPGVSNVVKTPPL